jgi:halimadienyl-diphosphate synthase
MVESLIDKKQQLSTLKLQDKVLALLEEVVADFDQKWGGGKMSAAVYDIAWVAMVRDPHNPQKLAFPDSFNWLLQHQSIDGSWGSLPQTLLPTLAALLALLKAPKQTDATRCAAKRAEAHLQAAFNKWSVNQHESVGFEVLVLALLEELENLGVVLEFPDKTELLKLYHQKLCITAPELIYSGHSNLIHSLEAFGSSIDFQRLGQLQAANGSYGCSPAATAAFLIYSPQWDTAAADWLTHLSDKARSAGEPGAMPNAYPIDVFESSWVFYNFIQAGIDFTDEAYSTVLQRLRIWLQESVTQKGASISRMIGMPTDSDDTGMVLAAHNLLANKIGLKRVSIDCLQHFERDTHFACFELERGISLSANAHVLAALLSEPTPPGWVTNNNTINKLVDYLYSVRNRDGYWEDKWHMSPFYATACTTMALAEHPDPSVLQKLQPTVEWILATQSPKDGGWGSHGNGCSTLEETAYALQILNVARERLLEKKPLVVTQNECSEVMRRGIQYLWQHLEELSFGTQVAANPRLPYLWRGKELYVPWRVVHSVVLAVLYQACAKEAAIFQ